MTTATATDLEVHPIAEVFPMMSESDLDALAESIARRGLIEPIVLHDGRVLDGRNRLEACRRADVEPTFREWTPRGDDDTPEQWALDENANRREMTTSQRACVAAGLAAILQQAGETVRDAIAHASTRLAVSERTVYTAHALRTESPESFARALAGDVKVSAARKALDEDAREELPEPERERLEDSEAGKALARAVTALLSTATAARVYGLDGWVDEDRAAHLVRLALDEMDDEEALGWSRRPSKAIALLGVLDGVARSEFTAGDDE